MRDSIILLVGIVIGLFLVAAISVVFPSHPPLPATDTVSFGEWDEETGQWREEFKGMWREEQIGPGDLILPDFVSYEDRLEERVSQLERDVERLCELTRTQSDLIVKLGLDLSRLRHLDLYTPDPIGVDD